MYTSNFFTRPINKFFKSYSIQLIFNRLEVLIDMFISIKNHIASVKYQSIKSFITQVERNKLHDIFHNIIFE